MRIDSISIHAVVQISVQMELLVRTAGAKQYARIQGHLYERAAGADAVRRWVLAQPIHTLLFCAALSFFKALTRELEDSPIARVPCDG
jgi:hypothetical protein